MRGTSTRRRTRRRAKVQTDRDRTAEEVQLGKVLDFMRTLWALDHALQTSSKRMRSKLGVTGLQRFAIRIVGRFPSISAGQLAEILHVHPSTLTGVIEKLAQRQALIKT